jgi:superfamily II DNA/RNA helicase
LADQIAKELTPLARSVDRWIGVVYGGVGYGPQITAIRKGVDLLVATPGRLEDLMAQGVVDLGDVDIVIVDEADRMADMGFLPAVRRILDRTSSARQTLLFSATLDGDIAQLSRDYQTDPVTHVAGSVETDAAEAVHHFWLVDRETRVEHAADLIRSSGRTIVFTRTRHGADRLAKQLDRLGVNAVAMHGGLSQNQRNRSLRAFTKGEALALVATDVAARGIHVDGVSTVMHFDPAEGPKDYLHRSGRTARAGATGTVVSLVMHDQRRKVAGLQREMGMNVAIDKPGSIPVHTRPVSRPAGPTATGHRLYVGNLPWSATSDDLSRLFSRHAKVAGATIATKRGRSQGYGFVEVSGPGVSEIISAMAGTRIGDRPLNIRAAR